MSSKFEYLKKLIPMLEENAGKTIYNKGALNTLKAEAAREAELAAQLAAKDAGEFSNTQLRNSLGDLDPSSLPKTNETGFELVGSPQSKDFVLGEAGPISRVPSVIKPGEAPKHLPAVIPEELKVNLSGMTGMPTPDQDRLTKLKQFAGVLGVGTAGAIGVNALSGGGAPQLPGMSTPVGMVQGDRKPAVESVETVEPPTETEKAMMKLRAYYSRPGTEEQIKPVDKTVDFGEDQSIASADNLKMAQGLQNEAQLGTSLGRIGAGLAAGIAGTKNNFDEVIADNGKQTDIVKQYQNQVQMEKEDPNSPMSKGYKALAKKMGFDIKGTASAGDLEKLIPQLANIYNQEEAQKSRRDIARENREGRLAELQLRLAGMKDQKDGAGIEKDRQKLGEVTNFNKQARGNAAAIQNLVQQSERLQTLIDAVPKKRNGEPDLSKVTPLQKEELIRTFDVMLAGKSTVSGQQELMKSADSVYNEAAKLKQYFTGNKAYGNEAGMLKSIVDTVNREKGLATEKVKDMSFEASIGFKRLNQKDPDYVKEILKQKAMMDDYDIEMRQNGYRSYDINRLLLDGYDKAEIAKMAKDGIKPHSVKAKGIGEGHKLPASAPPIGASGLTPEERQRRILELKAKAGQ